MVADVAVVRMAGPAAGSGFDRLGDDLPRGVPYDRWDADAMALTKNSVRFSGFLDGELRLNALSVQSRNLMNFFRIGLRDADAMALTKNPVLSSGFVDSNVLPLLGGAHVN